MGKKETEKVARAALQSHAAAPLSGVLCYDVAGMLGRHPDAQTI